MSNDINVIFNSALAQNGNGIEDDTGGPVSRGKGRAAAGKGWLYAMAAAMGKLADAKAAKLEESINNLPDDAKPSEMLQIQADTQEFSLMMNTFTNAIKTLGEGNTAAGRKSG